MSTHTHTFFDAPSPPPPLVSTKPLAAGTFNRRVMVGGHSALLAILGLAIRRLVPDDQGSIKRFYLRIWDLFYLEYAMYPFM